MSIPATAVRPLSNLTISTRAIATRMLIASSLPGSTARLDVLLAMQKIAKSNVSAGARRSSAAKATGLGRRCAVLQCGRSLLRDDEDLVRKVARPDGVVFDHRLASKLLLKPPASIIDKPSGAPALRYLEKVSIK